MDRRSFFAAFFGAMTGGLVVEAVRAAAAPAPLVLGSRVNDALPPHHGYEPPRVTYVGNICDGPLKVGGWTEFDDCGNVIHAAVRELHPDGVIRERPLR